MKENRCNAVKVYLLVIALSIAGCTMPYVAPSGIDLAKVRIMMSSKDYFINVGVFRGGMCNDLQTLGRLGPYGPEKTGETSSLNMLGGKAGPDPYRKERQFPGNQPLTLVLGASWGYGFENYYCENVFTFSPKSNAEYEIKHELIKDNCLVSIFELSSAPDGAIFRTTVTDIKKETQRCSTWLK